MHNIKGISAANSEGKHWRDYSDCYFGLHELTIPALITSWLWVAALSLQKQIKFNFRFTVLSEYLGQKVMANGSF